MEAPEALGAAEAPGAPPAPEVEAPEAQVEPGPWSLALLPRDTLPGVVTRLDPRSVGQIAAASREFLALCGDEVWRALALAALWPCDGALLELLASGLARARGRRSSWRALFQAHRAASETLVVDVGHGYTKYGFPPRAGGAPAAPAVLQLCSSPTHPADASRQRQLPAIVDRVARGAPRRTIPMLVGEPFNMMSPTDAAAWRDGFVAPQLASGTRCTYCPQPLLALLAHGCHQDGVVMNIGQREVVVAPCLDGRVCYEAIRVQQGMGASMLTQVMLELLVARNEGVDWGMLTWCRDLKEKHCEVAPRPLAGEDGERLQQCLPTPVEVRNGSLRLRLGLERFQVPEVLFQRGRASLPALTLQAVKIVLASQPPGSRQSVAQRLLRSIVVVGGTAELPGMHDRLQRELETRLQDMEWACLRQGGSSPEVCVRPPPPGVCEPRTAVLRGGQLMVLATCAAQLSGRRPGPGPHDSCDVEELDDVCSERPPLAACCSTPWRRPTRLGDLRGYIAVARRTAASTVAVLRHVWRAAVGSGPGEGGSAATVTAAL